MNILITGANRGLGLSMIKTGLEKGHHMFAGIRDLSNSHFEYLLGLQKMYKGKLEMIELDVTSESSVENAVKEYANYSEVLDVLINNAGILKSRDERIEDLNIENCLDVINTNTLGPLRVIKHFIPFIKRGKSPSIINISSDAASLTKVTRNDYPYSLSKVGLNMITEKLRVDLSEENIQVLSIHPGWMKTDMGGKEAPLNPLDSAARILKIIERKKRIESPHGFIDFRGIPQDL